MKKTDKYKDSITKKIKKARFREALEELEEFVKIVNDKELSRQVLILHARFNTEFKKQLSGLSDNIEEQNKIVISLSYLLDEADEIAQEKISRIEEEKVFNRDYRDILINEFKKFLDEKENKLLNDEVNYDSLLEFLYSRFPGMRLVISPGFIETFPQLLIENGYSKISHLEDLLQRTKEARIKFNQEEEFGLSASRELFIALGFDIEEKERYDIFAQSKDIELMKKHGGLVRNKK